MKERQTKIKKPVLMGSVMYFLIRLLLMMLIVFAVFSKAIIDYGKKTYYDHDKAVREIAGVVLNAEIDGISSAELSRINDRVNELAADNTPVMIYIPSRGERDYLIADTTFGYGGTIKYGGEFRSFFGRWYDTDDPSAFSQVAECFMRSGADVGRFAELQSAWFDPENDAFFPAEVNTGYYLFGFHFAQKTIDLTPSDRSLIRNCDLVDLTGEGYRLRDVEDFFAAGEIRNFEENIEVLSEEDQISVVVCYEHYNSVYQSRVRVAEFAAAAVIMLLVFSVVLGIIRYHKEKSVYEIFEYRKMMTAAMAHDLKTPLAIASLSAANLTESLGKDPGRALYHADEIETSIKYMDKLIGNILDFSNSEQDGYVQEKTVIDLRDLAEEYIERIRKLIENRGLKIKVKGDAKIKADRKLLGRAFDNIIDNAVKYSSDKSEIEVEISCGHLTVINRTDSDIPDAAGLIEPFRKGDSARGENSGSGLGLAVARNDLAALGFALKVSCVNKFFKAEMIFR